MFATPAIQTPYNSLFSHMTQIFQVRIVCDPIIACLFNVTVILLGFSWQYWVYTINEKWTNVSFENEI